MSTISTKSGENAYLVVWTTGEYEGPRQGGKGRASGPRVAALESSSAQAVLVTNATTAAGQYLEAARGDFRTALEMVNKSGEFWERVRSHLRNAERAEREPHGLYVVR